MNKLLLWFCFSGLSLFGQQEQLKRSYECPPGVQSSTLMHQINISEYRKKFSEPAQEWLKVTTDHELAFFQTRPITQKALNATYKRFADWPQDQYLRRIRMIGNRVYAYDGMGPPRADCIWRTLAMLSDYEGVPDLPAVDFMLNHNDGMPMPYDPPNFWIAEDEELQAPVFSGGKRADAPYIIAVPHDWSLPQWKHMYDCVINSRSPWHSKEKAVCWRGNVMIRGLGIARNGQLCFLSNYEEMVEQTMSDPRTLICQLSQRAPSLVNAGFSSNIDWMPWEEPKRRLRALIKDRMSWSAYIGHAYLPELDGAMISGLGFEWKLLSGSLLFKVDSSFVSWLEHGLQSYENYIPIHRNLDNLLEKIVWAHKNDHRCKQMADTGRIFAERNLSLEGQLFFYYNMLKEYEKCQDFSAQDLLEDCERDPKWIRIR